MQAALPDVSVQRAPISIPVEKLPEIPQISTDFIGRNGGIFPSLPGFILSRDASCCTEAGFANFPDNMFFLIVVVEFHRWNDLLRTQIVHQAARFFIGFLFRVAAKFDKKPALAVWQQAEIF